MTDIKKAKAIAKTMFRTVSEKGTPCKTIFVTFDNGVVHINQLFLIKGDDDIRGMVKIYSRFGHSLYVASMGLKYSSMMTIMISATKILRTDKVDEKDIL